MDEHTDNICEEGRFQAVFNDLGRSLRNFLYYKSGNLQQAEDLSQEAFIRLWKACAKVSPGKAKAFLFQVANNLFLDQLKHEGVQLKFRNFQERQTKSGPIDPAASLEAAEFRERLEQAIADLPPKNRAVFLMNRIDGLTYQEIADRLALSKKAIEKRMSKALVELRAALNTD